ncbi:MAG: glycogen synthase, partial [Proteobacteria bacterium]|nr:glycogen synthase [Pseudomonadota bacterium]
MVKSKKVKAKGASPLRVAFVSSEATPFAKTGGLADVSGALPVALKRLDIETALFMPYYKEHVELSGAQVKATGLSVKVAIGKRVVEGEIFTSSIDNVTVYLLECDIFFSRPHLYGPASGEYFDNFERFTFFSRGALEAMKLLDFKPDVIHCNDWQTGLIPAYLSDIYAKDRFFSSTASVFTIHNLAFQGIFDAVKFSDTGLSSGLNSLDGLEFWGSISFLKAGINFADIVTTVSESYCKEIQSEEFGCGLDGVLKLKKNLYGVLNGVDYSIWDPAIDTLIPANYSSDNPKCKALCKLALKERFALDLPAGTPIIGMVSRLTPQKGFDIIVESIEELMKMEISLVLLGSGESEYEEFFEKLAKKYPGRVGVRIGYDDELAHLIEAGSDIFLMPSYYEPCGLNQIYSLRYGTIPVVRAVGGLNDTIRDYKGAGGNGFKFKRYSSKALMNKLKEA